MSKPRHTVYTKDFANMVCRRLERENKNLQKEVERLNIIINELELWLKAHSIIDYENSEIIIHEQLALNMCLQYLQDLKGEVK